MTGMQQPILNIVVIGFHHKKGCQVEFCYPEVNQNNPNELPAAWKHLPALALPDGSHNYLNDTVFFHLPSLTEPAHTVFAVSCFRQIPVEQVTQRTSDMTRSSVQKSVCVISKAPLFGRLAIKMELVVRAWFRQGDFSKTKLLEDAFKHFNNCPVHIDQIYEGLSAVSFIQHWQHKALLLFKLILLQRKVVIYGSPAGPLTSCLLTLLSLLPACLQSGLNKSANVVLSRPLSPPTVLIGDASEISEAKFDTVEEADNATEVEPDMEFFKERQHSFDEIKPEDNIEKNNLHSREKCHSVGEHSKLNKSLNESQSNPSIARNISIEGLNNFFVNLNIADCGLPLHLFENGYLCLPYLSLQYLDVLSDPAVKGFIIGASNVLFKQKRQLFDILVEVTDMRIETADSTLRRQLQLTTEDLRFADHILRYGSAQGDSWIRDQFGGYLLNLLKTSLLPEGSREIDHFNTAYVTALKTTYAYNDWMSRSDNESTEAFSSVTVGHPFSGQLSVTDMKLRLTHTMTNTDSGRKVTQAVINTGRAVATTSRAVGGAITQAKGALSIWWNTLTTPSPQSENAPQSDSDIDAQIEEPEDLIALPSEEKNSCSDAEEALEIKKISPKDESDSEDALQLLREAPDSIDKIEVI